MEKGIIYVRVSTDKQDYKTQLKALEQKAKDENIDIVKIFAEKISGTISGEDRPQFSKLLKFVESKEVKHLLIWEFSRLGRNITDIQESIIYFTKKNINIRSISEGISTIKNGVPDPMAGIIVQVLAGISDIERESIVARTKRGVLEFKQGGGSQSRPPYGYKNIDQKLVKNPDEIETIINIFNWYSNNIGSDTIAERLNLAGIPTKYGGKEWTSSVVIPILKNNIYIGNRKILEEFSFFESLQIISDDTFEKVKFQLNKKKWSREKKNINVLQGLIFCSCGKLLTMRKRLNGKENVYRCSSFKDKSIKCNNKAIDIDLLNNLVFDVLREDDSEVDADELTRLMYIAKDDLDFAGLEYAKLLKEEDKANKKIDRLFFKDKIDERQADIYYEEIKNEIKLARINKFQKEKFWKIAVNRTMGVYNNDELQTHRVPLEANSFKTYVSQHTKKITVELVDKTNRVQIDLFDGKTYIRYVDFRKFGYIEGTKFIELDKAIEI